MLQLKTEYFTYDDYKKWDDGIRCELIDGLPYAMSPAPSWFHQEVGFKIAQKISIFLEGKPCKVFVAPFDVRLNFTAEDDIVVQPDITVICDRSKLSKKGGGCNGVPDMVVEILSPSTARMDRFTKYNKYRMFGVREYWIVDPAHKIVETHILNNGNYIKYTYIETDTVPVHVLDGCNIELADVFADIDIEINDEY